MSGDQAGAVEPLGHCDPAFGVVRDVFVEHFRRHPSGGAPEVGASVSVVVDGRTVVDLWAGWADAEHRRPWERDTVVCAWSATKGVVALAVHMLVEEGLLDHDAPVTTVWPEFGAAGKEGVTLRHLLSHQAALPTLRRRVRPGGVWEWQEVVDAFAGATPLWEPGTAHAYHVLSFGHLVGEVIRRAAGDDPWRVVDRLVVAPLGVDFSIGLAGDQLTRCADLVPGPAGDPPVDLAAVETLDDFDQLAIVTGSTAVGNSDRWRMSRDSLAAGGFTNGRALARIYGALAGGGGIDGVRLVSAGALERACEVQTSGADVVTGAPRAWALGWMRPSASAATPRAVGSGFGHCGRWGAIGWAEPDAKLGFGYAMNQLVVDEGDPRAARLLNAALDCI